MSKKFKDLKLWVWTALLIIILMAPVIFYIYTFGIKISMSHQRWSEFGSFLSGIYTPVISILTLIVLVRQLEIQANSDKHQRDEAYLQNAVKDIEYYLSEIKDLLKTELFPNEKCEDWLHKGFLVAINEEVAIPERKSIAIEINYRWPKIFTNWNALYTVFSGLCATDELPYSLYAKTQVSKISAALSWKTCAALDNFLFCCLEKESAKKGNGFLAKMFRGGIW